MNGSNGLVMLMIYQWIPIQPAPDIARSWYGINHMKSENKIKIPCTQGHNVWAIFNREIARYRGYTASGDFFFFFFFLGGGVTVPQELYNRPLNDSNGTIMLIIYQWIPTPSTPGIARFRPHEKKSERPRDIEHQTPLFQLYCSEHSIHTGFPPADPLAGSAELCENQWAKSRAVWPVPLEILQGSTRHTDPTRP